MEISDVSIPLGFSWQPLRSGSSGINWAASDAADCFDPLLAWADATDYAGYERIGGKIAVLIERDMRPQATRLWATLVASGKLDVPAIYANSRFVTARIDPSDLSALKGAVVRVDASLTSVGATR
jgi:hypothetical protein